MRGGSTNVVGSVRSLWRYPVKSMLGERLDEVDIELTGLRGDRAYAVIDRSDSKVASAKNPRKWRGLLELRADPSSPVADATLTANRSVRILVYCTKGPGARSLLAAQTLKSMGYEHVEVLGGGLMAWAEAGLPVERETQPNGAE